MRFSEISGDGRLFALMTFQPFRPWLASIVPPLHALAAFDGEMPCGFLLGAFDPEKRTSRLLSIFVRRLHRRQGLARELLRRFESKWPADRMVTRWSDAAPGAAAFERLLGAVGFAPKQLDMLQCDTTPASVAAFASNRTLGRGRAGIAGFTWTSWTARATQDDEVIGGLTLRDDFPARLDPYAATGRIAIWSGNSMVLRRYGVPVGWGITAREGELLVYDCMYVRPELARLGVSILMLVEMFRIQGEMLGPHSPARYFVSPKTPAMVAISRGGLRAALQGYREHYSAWYVPPGARAASTFPDGVAGDAASWDERDFAPPMPGSEASFGA